MRIPVIVGVIGGVGAGKEAFSKSVQRHLAEKFKLVTFIVHENAKSDHSVLSEERLHDQAMESMKADVIMVNGSSFLRNEKLRSQLDLKIYLHSDSDKRLANYVKRNKGKRTLEDAMERYFTEVKPKDLATLESEKHADFLAQTDMSQGEPHGLIRQDKMNLLGLMISDLCGTKETGSSTGALDL
uniref:PRK domain-containing protein n=1 Tax=Ascaris lumbricoides TaxID=6252 RepID=A0A0M3ISS6_ASCLU